LVALLLAAVVVSLVSANNASLAMHQEDQREQWEEDVLAVE
jgi:hypothetical protein